MGKHLKVLFVFLLCIATLLATGCSAKNPLGENSVQAVVATEDSQETHRKEKINKSTQEIKDGEENNKEFSEKNVTKEETEKEIKKEKKSEEKPKKQSDSKSNAKSKNKDTGKEKDKDKAKSSSAKNTDSKDKESSEKSNTKPPESEPKLEKKPESKPKPTKFVYLTFDDGPSAVTGELLDVLKKHNVNATFFVNGVKDGNKAIYTKMIKRIVNEGHAIGNHGDTHDYSISYASKEKFKENVDNLDKYLQEVSGVKTRLYRFQGGSSNGVHKEHLKGATMKDLFNLMNNSGYRYFDWNVSSGDSGMVTPPASRSVKYVLKGVKGKTNSIVLMHDSEHKTENPKAVDEIITKLKEQGYGFKKLSMDSYNYQHRK